MDYIGFIHSYNAGTERTKVDDRVDEQGLGNCKVGLVLNNSICNTLGEVIDVWLGCSELFLIVFEKLKIAGINLHQFFKEESLHGQQVLSEMFPDLCVPLVSWKCGIDGKHGHI